MNKIYKIINVEDSGAIHFTFLGENKQDVYDVSIIDENTGLTVNKSKLALANNTNWWISTGESNAKRLKNITFNINYDGIDYKESVKLNGQSRYLVINSKKVNLSNMGDNLFPIVTEIFYDKIYERDFVRLTNNDVVVDIGANYGVFSLYSQMFNPKVVYSVEPLKSTFDHMSRNLNEYNAICINKAISDIDGYERFTVTDVNGNNFSSKNSDGYHPSSSLREEIVETININTLIKEYNIDKIDFLKVDCEGGEFDLFNTIDREYLRENISKIAIEYHSGIIKSTIMDILLNNGFIIEDVVGYDDIGLIYAYNEKKFNV